MAQETNNKDTSSVETKHGSGQPPKRQSKSQGPGRGAARVKKPPFANKSPAYPVPSQEGAASGVLEASAQDTQTYEPSAFMNWWQATGKLVSTGIILFSPQLVLLQLQLFLL